MAPVGFAYCAFVRLCPFLPGMFRLLPTRFLAFIPQVFPVPVDSGRSIDCRAGLVGEFAHSAARCDSGFPDRPKSSLRSAVSQMQEAASLSTPTSWCCLRAGEVSPPPSRKVKKYVDHAESASGELARATSRRVLFVEGSTFRQWRAKLDQHPDLRHETKGLSEEAEIAIRLGIEGVEIEGWLLPDTHLFDNSRATSNCCPRAPGDAQ